MNINLTLIAQLVSSRVFVWFTMKYVWPPLVRRWTSAKPRSLEGLAAAAEREQHEQELAEKRTKDTCIRPSNRLPRSRPTPKSRPDDRRRGPRQGQEEGHRQLVAAQAEITQEINKAREGLRAKVAELAVLGAEKILRKEIDADAHKDIVESVANQI